MAIHRTGNLVCCEMTPESVTNYVKTNIEPVQNTVSRAYQISSENYDRSHRMNTKRETVPISAHT